MRGKFRKNAILGLNMGGGRRLMEVIDIKEEVKNHFWKRFFEPVLNISVLDWAAFNSLSNANRSFLEAPFLLEDVREVMWLSSCDKSSGPDGFSLGFFRKCWVFMKDEVGNFVNEFHKNRFLPKAVTASFIALIPKTDNPQGIDEFRPICLAGCLYRLISKLLVSRLKVVIKKLVSSSQTTFIEGRQMVDGVLVLNEVLDYAKRFKKECLVVKVDSENDFDYVS
ncbi:uncharacterized protein LOC131614676 [Vicia villosa]|uniref:uncharacterized protein LOC131614676 n=1 Tax=Vicia villosa TaxID=3911 RepID=UPI00273BDFB4|nr:uncharacterized protein LOC131614676 [Vicia villosa]